MGAAEIVYGKRSSSNKKNVPGRKFVTTLETVQKTVRNYAITSRLNREEDQEYQPDACEIFGNIKFDDEEDNNDPQAVMDKLQDFFVGDTHEAFESYKFHLRKQEASESIERYIAARRMLAKTCNFDKLEERLNRDQVVVGVREEGLRGKSLSRQTTDNR